MSDTYYEYEKVKVKIAHRLFNMDGWKVYGWHNDNSDPMTDYYDPASWNGIAEKNGYRLVIDKSYSRKDTTETRVRYNNGNLSHADIEKIKKLEQMTQERGASEQEEQTARAAIEKIKSRVEEGREEYTVFTPGHMANPPRCNWHIEKDGIIYDKGTGLLKFYGVPDISKEDELKDWQEFNTKSREQWISDYVKWLELHPYYFNGCDTEEERKETAERKYKVATEDYALLEKFNLLIARFNNVCGGMVGNAGTDTYTYEEITVTEYKTELKPVEKPGEIREGQCFILKSSFNYGRYAGYVYRIHKSYIRTDGKQAYKAYRLGKGYKKERTGNATPSNEWSIYNTDELMKWINKGAIAFCELEEVKTPYEVKKVVKKYNKATEEEPETTTAATENADIEPETVTTEEHATEPENVKESHTELETATEEEQPENVKAAFTAFSNFEELAKAYATGKTATPKKKTEPKPEEPKQAEQAEAKKPEQEPEPEPEPVKPLHNENFTAEEIARLTTGGCVIKEFKPYTTHYTALHATDNIMVWYVYKQENFNNYKFRIGDRNNLIYTGFIYNGKMYTDYKRINEEFTEAINRRMIEMIPSEQDAWNRAENLTEWEGEQLRDFIKIDWTAEARKYFYKGEEPQLKLFDSYKSPSTEEEALYYITRPDEAVQTYADIFIKGRVASIIKIYIEYNGIREGLKQIKSHPENIAHTIKKISDCVTDEKTVKVTVKTGETYRIEARNIKNMTHWSYINKYDIPGRNTDIQPEEIAEITHGKRILYSV